ncbi:hypothetical protein [Pseudoalteromonas marina]|uniref:Transposase n=1 Tax=Pseudoalteromonas marina TaxID=267375 RepID=A0ABT9FJ97_9GAMM|nr:hypothetical protein [Pseudoalteromonas marina]MDP2566837.1 hypothetical protein [Pseudoalteromonas marina]
MAYSLYQLGTAPKLHNKFDHREHRGAARYTEKSLIQCIGFLNDFSCTAPCLLCGEEVIF